MTRLRLMLKLYREHTGVSVAELARQIRIPRTTMDQLLLRSGNTKGGTLAKLLIWALSDGEDGSGA